MDHINHPDSWTIPHLPGHVSIHADVLSNITGLAALVHPTFLEQKYQTSGPLEPRKKLHVFATTTNGEIMKMKTSIRQ